MKHLDKIKPTFISIFSLNTDLFKMLYQTLRRVFHQDIQTPRSFSTHFSVFGYPDETLFLVFGILHLTRLLCSLVRYPGQFSWDILVNSCEISWSILVRYPGQFSWDNLVNSREISWSILVKYPGQFSWDILVNSREIIWSILVRYPVQFSWDNLLNTREITWSKLEINFRKSVYYFLCT